MAGNRLSRTTEGRTERYHYNSRSQLTELDSAAETVQYEYDHAGNLTAESHIPQGGNITRRIEYTYDAYNRNTSVCSAGCVQQNHYDAEGLRNAVTENGSTTNFVYRNGMLSSELDADRNPVRRYVYGNEYISQNNGSSFSYYLDDEQGSIRYLTGSDGSIRNHYRYSAFGESITAEETVPNRLKYNAQMADELTGLYYLRARYYNASLGRFTQEDVIYNDGLNLYAYCNSNPVMYSDPSGFAKETCKSKVGRECDSESGKYSVFGEMSEVDSVRYRDWNYEKIHEISIHNPNADSMTLGKYFDGTIESGSYIARAELTGDTYFSLGTQWNDITQAYGLSDKEMFNLFNTRALDDAVMQGKTIRFSQNPLDWSGTALGDEWSYLQHNHGYRDLIEMGGYWYAIK